MYSETFENNNYYIYFPEKIINSKTSKAQTTIIYWGFDSNHLEQVNLLFSMVSKHNLKCIIIAYETTCWNSAFSPWVFKDVDNKYNFEGQAKSTLEQILNFKHHFECTYEFSNSISLLCGYSLCGLFCLWCLSDSAEFQGAISCSGSLWYPGWIEYIKEHLYSYKSKFIYLSLGKKECGFSGSTSIMKDVESNTRLTYQLIKEINSNNDLTIFELNNGGHFTDQTERIFKGIMRSLEMT